ncbi:hypothetical protein TrST_g10774 [Triparma strigata]|uniref:Uncharacterized protein n=1 Tax=Triparma strigata TaxID=1606541 RepID=A0A9W7F018_9STRA|nr:hypothetical protein TrST_g10774 [Triparma strigata]
MLSSIYAAAAAAAAGSLGAYSGKIGARTNTSSSTSNGGISKTKQKRKDWFKKQAQYAREANSKLDDIKRVNKGLRTLEFFDNESTYHRNVLRNIKRTKDPSELLSISSSSRLNNITLAALLRQISLHDPSNSTSSPLHPSLVASALSLLTKSSSCLSVGGPGPYSSLRLSLSKLTDLPPTLKACQTFHSKSFPSDSLALLESCAISSFPSRHPDVKTVLSKTDSISSSLSHSGNLQSLLKLQNLLLHYKTSSPHVTNSLRNLESQNLLKKELGFLHTFSDILAAYIAVRSTNLKLSDSVYGKISSKLVKTPSSSVSLLKSDLRLKILSEEIDVLAIEFNCISFGKCFEMYNFLNLDTTVLEEVIESRVHFFLGKEGCLYTTSVICENSGNLSQFFKELNERDTVRNWINRKAKDGVEAKRRIGIVEACERRGYMEFRDEKVMKQWEEIVEGEEKGKKEKEKGGKRKSLVVMGTSCGVNH